jgi:hypothetical protein
VTAVGAELLCAFDSHACLAVSISKEKPSVQQGDCSEMCSTMFNFQARNWSAQLPLVPTGDGGSGGDGGSSRKGSGGTGGDGGDGKQGMPACSPVGPRSA